MLRPGFEPESSARKAEMIGRTTPTEHTYITNLYKSWFRHILLYEWAQWDSNPWPPGYEPGALPA